MTTHRLSVYLITLNNMNKDEAMSLFTRDRKELLETCRYLARHLASRNPRHEITIDEVRQNFKVPAWINPKFFGAVFSNDSDWEQVGYKKSTRKEANGRPIGIWRYKNAPKGQETLFN